MLWAADNPVWEQRPSPLRRQPFGFSKPLGSIVANIAARLPKQEGSADVALPSFPETSAMFPYHPRVMGGKGRTPRPGRRHPFWSLHGPHGRSRQHLADSLYSSAVPRTKGTEPCAHRRQSAGMIDSELNDRQVGGMLPWLQKSESRPRLAISEKSWRRLSWGRSIADRHGRCRDIRRVGDGCSWNPEVIGHPAAISGPKMYDWLPWPITLIISHARASVFRHWPSVAC